MAEIPEHLLKRSRDAMAKAKGVPVEELLSDADESPGQEPAAEEAAEAAAAETLAEEAAPPEPVAVVVSPGLTKSPPPPPPARRRDTRVPAWLMSAYLFVPVLLVFLGLAVANVAEHAPASKPKKKASPGKEVYAGAGCNGCHGANGEGASGPALKNVVKVFPDADDQVAWVKNVAAGTSGPYGANGSGNEGKGSSVGAMPAFEGQLSDEKIKQVVDFERQQFGGEKP